MTINYSRYVESQSTSTAKDGKRAPKPPPHVWYAVEPPFKGYQPAPVDGFKESTGQTAIVIDNGMENRA